MNILNNITDRLVAWYWCHRNCGVFPDTIWSCQRKRCPGRRHNQARRNGCLR